MAVDGCEYLLFGFLSLVIHINYICAVWLAVLSQIQFETSIQWRALSSTFPAYEIST